VCSTDVAGRDKAICIWPSNGVQLNQYLCILQQHAAPVALPACRFQAKGSDGSGYDGEDTGDADTEDGTDNGGSSRRHKAGGAKRARLGGATSSNPDAAGGPGQAQGRPAGAADPAEAAAMATMTGAAGYGGLDMLQLQAYQAQYWDQTQTEVSTLLCFLWQMGRITSCSGHDGSADGAACVPAARPNAVGSKLVCMLTCLMPQHTSRLLLCARVTWLFSTGPSFRRHG